MYNSMDDGAEYKITQFMDLTEEEFRAGFTGYVSSGEDAPVEVEPASAKESNVTSIDWTTKGAVTPVKNQGQCGSCWAFSTTGNIEGQNFMKTGKLVSLSEQQLVDCDTKQDHGCQGGLPSNAYEYIIQSKGLDTETSYPYTGSDGSCHYQKSSVGATISNWTK